MEIHNLLASIPNNFLLQSMEDPWSEQEQIDVWELLCFVSFLSSTLFSAKKQGLDTID